MDCIFCKIVNGEIPSYKVYEDELFLGFLDIFPRAKGHVLLIPKQHHRWVNDVPAFTRYWETARTLAKRLEQTLGVASTSYLTYGEQVAHAHIQIVPIYPAESYLTLSPAKKYSPEEMEKIRKLITNNKSHKSTNQ